MSEYKYNKSGSQSHLYNYIYGKGQKVARTSSSETEYYHNDYLGSARLMTDADGNNIWLRDYYPFGNDKDATGYGNDYKFTGKEEDEESGLYHFLYRKYLPFHGRWYSVDPSWILRPSLSPYTYCGNNPLRYIDILGMDWLPPNSEKNPNDYWMYEFDPVVVIGSRYRSSFSSSGGINDYTWFERNYPRATENNSWFYKFWRGTGDINKDLISFSLGVTAAPIVEAATVYGGVAYGPTVVALMTKYGAILSSMGLTTQQEVHAWVTTVGADKAGRFLQSIHNLGLRLGHFYYVNKYTIDSFFYGIGDAFTPSYPSPTGILPWYFTGYSTGYGLNQGYNQIK